MMLDLLSPDAVAEAVREAKTRVASDLAFAKNVADTTRRMTDGTWTPKEEAVYLFATIGTLLHLRDVYTRLNCPDLATAAHDEIGKRLQRTRELLDGMKEKQTACNDADDTATQEQKP